MGGSGPSNITQTTNPPAWASPTAYSLLGAAIQELLPGSQQAQSSIAGQGAITPRQMPAGLNQQVAPLTADQLAGIQAIEGGAGGAMGLAGMGAGNLGATLSGAYLNPASNPYLTATYNEAAQGLVNQYQTSTAPTLMAEGEAASGGGPGSVAGNSAIQQEQQLNQYSLGQNLNNLATNIYGGNYQAERSNQMQALGLLGNTESALMTPGQALLGAGGVQQQQQQNVLNTNYQNALTAANWPIQQLGALGSLYNQAIGGSSVNVGTNPYAAK